MQYRRPLITLLSLLLCSVATADVATRLTAFNKSQTAANANCMLNELKTEGLLDDDF